MEATHAVPTAPTPLEDPATPPVSDEQKHEVAIHSYGARSVLTALGSIINSGYNRKQLLNSIQMINDNVNGIASTLATQVEPKFYNMINPNDSTVASTVLSIPEVLELILLHADHEDIMSMCKVSHGIRDTIEASSKLQMRLYHKSMDPTKLGKNEIISPFLNNTQTPFTITLSKTFGWLGIRTNATILTSKGKLPKIGAAWRRKLICQPAVKKMQVFICCDRHGTGCQRSDWIESETGLTLGNLYDKAERYSNHPTSLLIIFAVTPTWHIWTYHAASRVLPSAAFRISLSIENIHDVTAEYKVNGSS